MKTLSTFTFLGFCASQTIAQRSKYARNLCLEFTQFGINVASAFGKKIFDIVRLLLILSIESTL